MRVINPTTGAEGAEYGMHSEAEAAERIENSARAFESWRRTAWSERSGRMQAAADLLRERKPELARLMTEEMGKPITQSQGEIDKCAWVCEFYAENAERFLARQTIETDKDASSYVRFDPLGTVLAIMPWNFPFWQVFRFAAPYLTAGNVGLTVALGIEQVAQHHQPVWIRHQLQELGCVLGVSRHLGDGHGVERRALRGFRLGILHI